MIEREAILAETIKRLRAELAAEKERASEVVRKADQNIRDLFIPSAESGTGEYEWNAAVSTSLNCLKRASNTAPPQPKKAKSLTTPEIEMSSQMEELIAAARLVSAGYVSNRIGGIDDCEDAPEGGNALCRLFEAVRVLDSAPPQPEEWVEFPFSPPGPWWNPIETAPTDGTIVKVYAAEKEGLPGFTCDAAYHPDAGWCVDEIREVTHWLPLKHVRNVAPPHVEPRVHHTHEFGADAGYVGCDDAEFGMSEHRKPHVEAAKTVTRPLHDRPHSHVEPSAAKSEPDFDSMRIDGAWVLEPVAVDGELIEYRFECNSVGDMMSKRRWLSLPIYGRSNDR